MLETKAIPYTVRKFQRWVGNNFFEKESSHKQTCSRYSGSSRYTEEGHVGVILVFPKSRKQTLSFRIKA